MNLLEDTFMDEELGLAKKKPAVKTKAKVSVKVVEKPPVKRPKKKFGAKLKKGLKAVATGGISLAVGKGGPPILKKIGKGIAAAATGGMSLALQKKGPKAFRKIGKGLAAIATGGASLAVMGARKVAKKRQAKKTVARAKASSGLVARKSAPLVRTTAPLFASTVRQLAPFAAKLRIPMQRPAIEAIRQSVVERPESVIRAVETKMQERGYEPGAASKLISSVDTLAKRVDTVAAEKLIQAKPKDKRSRFKLQLFTKLKHLSSKLPTSHPTRVKLNNTIMACEEICP